MSVTIVGAGLAGLATAYRLHRSGIDVRILEANAFAGGRIQPAVTTGHQDLGPTWVWPYAQPVITQWLDDLGLTLFEQYDLGLGLVDSSANNPAQTQSLPSQYGIARINGGTHALVAALLNKLENLISYEHVVTNCEWADNQWQLTLAASNADHTPSQILTDQLIIAAPPRLSAAMLKSNDATLNTAIQLLKSTPTWMAPHAKIVILYDTPFWRDAGLSGRVASQVGPLAEIHDHSGPEATSGALFGFSGVPANVRQNAQEQFVAAIKQQLIRCFGETAPHPTDIIIKDWAFEPFTSTEEDRRGDGAHPIVLPALVRDAHCERSLWFGVSETAKISPGLIEGALARADEIASDLLGSN